MEKILISACLTGEKCKYDGGTNGFPFLEQLAKKYELVPFCPEVSGGLSTPREPAEQVKNSVLTKSGKDVTAQYNAGAEAALKACKFFGIRIAILKDNSPSCGSRHIDDGTFTHTHIEGLGVTARLLIANGIKVYADTDNLAFLLGESEEVKQARLERNLKKEEERKELQDQVKAGLISQEDMDRRLLQKKEQEKARKFGHGHGGHGFGHISHGHNGYGEHRSYEHRPYDHEGQDGERSFDEHKHFDHKPYGSHEGYGEHKSYGHSSYGHSSYGHHEGYGERKSYDHKPYDGEHSSYEHKPYDGEHKSYDHKPYGHSSYGHKPYGEHSSYGHHEGYGEHKPYDGEHKSYDHKPYDGEHKSYGHSSYGHSSYGHKPYDGEHKSYDHKPYDGEHKSYDHKPYGGHSSYGHKPYGEHKNYGHKPYNKGGYHSFHDKKVGGNDGDK